MVANLSRALSRAGHETKTYMVDNPRGLRAVPSLAASAWNVRQARAVRQELESFGADVTHVHNTWFALSPSVIAAAHEVGPLVMTLHNYRLTCANATLFREGQVCERCVMGSPWNGLWLNCYREPVSSGLAAASIATHRRRDTWNRNVDLFFVLSQFAKEVFIRAGIEHDRMRVMPSHVDDPGERPSPPSHSDYVLYVGRISEEKGAVQLAETWHHRAPRGMRLVICGSGPLSSSLRQSGSIDIRGWTSPEEVKELMLGARALVVPSRWYEGQPIAILEAFASGLPVLGSRLGGVAELVGIQGEDWLCSPDSEEDWTRGFEMLASTAPDAASHIVRTDYLNNHTESVVIEQVVNAYEAAIDRRSIQAP